MDGRRDGIELGRGVVDSRFWDWNSRSWESLPVGAQGEGLVQAGHLPLMLMIQDAQKWGSDDQDLAADRSPRSRTFSPGARTKKSMCVDSKSTHIDSSRIRLARWASMASRCRSTPTLQAKHLSEPIVSARDEQTRCPLSWGGVGSGRGENRGGRGFRPILTPKNLILTDKNCCPACRTRGRWAYGGV